MPKTFFLSLKVVLIVLLFVSLHVPTVAEGIDIEASIEESISKLKEEIEQKDIDAAGVEFERLKRKLKVIGPGVSRIKTSINTLKGLLDDPLMNPTLRDKLKAEFDEVEKILQEMEKGLASYIEQGVQEAIGLKDSRFSVTAITEILAKKPEYKFGTADLNSDQMKRLREQFDEDFIENWVGVPQHVTMGASAIYLTDANKAVGALVLRILTPPRSYFAELKVWPWSPIPNKSLFQSLKYNINPDYPDAWINRLDLNFGITSTSGTDNVEAGNFILAGLSYQLHRAAFLNAGLAFSTEGSFEDTAQLYIGVTVDSNILRSVGLIK